MAGTMTKITSPAEIVIRGWTSRPSVVGLGLGQAIGATTWPSLMIVSLPIYTGSMTLREPTFLILTSLASDPRHGYGIIQDIAALSDGRVKLRAGTLYGSLDRLVEEGLVAPDREEVENGRLRRYYRITGEGRRVLAAEAERMAANARAATVRLNMRGRMA